MDQAQFTDAAFATLRVVRTDAPVVDNDRLAVLLSRLLLDDGTAVAPMVWRAVRMEARNLAAVIDGHHPKCDRLP